MSTLFGLSFAFAAQATENEFKPEITSPPPAKIQPQALPAGTGIPAEAPVSTTPIPAPAQRNANVLILPQKPIQKPATAQMPKYKFPSNASPSSVPDANYRYTRGRVGEPDNLNTGPVNACGPLGGGPNMWQSATSVTSEGIIPANSHYNINAANWPKLRHSGNRLVVDFSPGKESMCTSATATAFAKHIADLVNAGNLTLTETQINYLNGNVVKNALNGNTFSVALLNQAMGGQNMYGSKSNGKILDALKQAHAGDVLKYDRTSGTGHSTIFKEIKGDEFCYWSSNTKTDGAGERCEPINVLVDVAVSRFPSDTSALPAKLDEMMGSSKLSSSLQTSTSPISARDVVWASGLECKGDVAQSPTSDKVRSPANGDGTTN